MIKIFAGFLTVLSLAVFTALPASASYDGRNHDRDNKNDKDKFVCYVLNRNDHDNWSRRGDFRFFRDYENDRRLVLVCFEDRYNNVKWDQVKWYKDWDHNNKDWDHKDWDHNNKDWDHKDWDHNNKDWDHDRDHLGQYGGHYVVYR